ncbi:MAG: ABC transporter ATP-binding protein [Candidatus Heimdallarchaeota archaeon]
MTIAIEVSDLTKFYGKLRAVDRISFNVKKGEIFGFLGPNGAGKTTTIKMLACLLKPDNGTATVEGHDVIHDSRIVRKFIGLVPERSNLYNELTVWDNLIFMAQLYGVPREKRVQKAHKLLDMFDLDEHCHKRFEILSKGLKRRLTIAAGLIHEPHLLFLDEPTVGLDVQSTRFIRRLITTLKEQEVTIFLTTHYIEEADQLCDRVAIINKGRIITIDTPEKLKARNQTRTILKMVLDHGADQLKEELEKRGLGSVTTSHDRLRILTDKLTPVLTFISSFIKDHELEIQAINTINPTLEDAFARITGLTPEEMIADKKQKK